MAEKKEFRAGIYAVIVGVVLAVVLTALTVYAFTTRYTGFSAEKVAQQYVDTIVQTGDGYNAYKNTLISVNKKIKYGDFIRRAYMVAYRNDGEDVPQADFVGTGSEEEQKAIDEVYNTMYDYYVQLINSVGWDNYNTFFSSYFSKLKEVRHEVYGDEYLDYEYMFGALEANVDAYGIYLAGAEEQLAADGKTVLREASEGKYQQIYGKDYRFTATTTECEELSEEETAEYIEGFRNRIEPIANSGEAKADSHLLTGDAKTEMKDVFAALNCADDISAVARATVNVKLDDESFVTALTFYVVKIGNCWYVDNTNIDSSKLYLDK